MYLFVLLWVVKEVLLLSASWMEIFPYPQLSSSVVKTAASPKLSMRSSKRGSGYVSATVGSFKLQ